MQMLKNKTITLMIALFLTISITTSIILSPTANAHTPPWKIISYAYLNVAPNTVGVGQTVAVCMWVDTPMPSATINNDIRRRDYTLTITSPDGKIESKHWDIIIDTTSVQFYQYTPTQVGNYTFKFDYAQQTYIWSGEYQNDTFLASSRTQYLTVQEDPIAMPLESYPLPTEYWSYPIEGQNIYWYTIASNWLGTPYIIGANSARPGSYQPDGLAPNSAHIMWTKPVQYGGIVGGNNTNTPAETFYNGLSYNTRFTNPLIIQGTLFYQEPYGNSGGGGDYVAVNLQTGQEQWRINTTATGTSFVPSFGYIYAFDSPNQHGVLPNGLLIATSGTTWRGYDPRTGVLTTMNITNVPSGTNIAGPAGEYLKYILTNLGTIASPKWQLMQWNSSKVFGTVSGTGVGTWYSGTVNASLPSAYDWNVSLTLPLGTWSIGTGAGGPIPLISLDNMLLLTQGTFGGHVGDSGATVTTNLGNITAISLNPNSRGQVLWTKSYEQAPGNNTRMIRGWDPNNGVFFFEDKESFERWGYSLNDGSYLWGPSGTTNDSTNDWNYMLTNTDIVAYGNFYSFGYSGIITCWDIKTGKVQWTYGNGGDGNNTSSGLVTPYGNYPIFIGTIADGKVYTITDEHSPVAPMYKGGRIRVLNATTGTEIWTLMGWGNMMNGWESAIASGYLATINPYDMQIYSIGKGPSAMTVEAPKISVELGKSIVISGTITDIAAGTKQNEQAARFPNGVPAVSDESMTPWMEYVYMQKPRPTNVVGVPVTISVVDANENYREIGTTTSNDGYFTFNWKPDIEGQYIVYASFAGSESYWPSQAITSFATDPAQPKDAPQTQLVLPPTEMYIVAAAVGIIIAVIIVGVILAMMIKKRP